MEFSEEYPNKPPVVRFVSKMFHPNGKCEFAFISICVCELCYKIMSWSLDCGWKKLMCSITWSYLNKVKNCVNIVTNIKVSIKFRVKSCSLFHHQKPFDRHQLQSTYEYAWYKVKWSGETSCALSYISEYTLHAKYWVESRPTSLHPLVRWLLPVGVQHTCIHPYILETDEKMPPSASQSYLTICSLAVTLTFDLLTSQS